MGNQREIHEQEAISVTAIGSDVETRPAKTATPDFDPINEPIIQTPDSRTTTWTTRHPIPGSVGEESTFTPQVDWG